MSEEKRASLKVEAKRVNKDKVKALLNSLEGATFTDDLGFLLCAVAGVCHTMGLGEAETAAAGYSFHIKADPENEPLPEDEVKRIFDAMRERGTKH